MLVLSKKEIEESEQYTINKIGISQEILMENAGVAIFNYIKTLVKPNNKIYILAGCGNNGGDGVVLARKLKQLNYNVNLIFIINNEFKLTDATNYHLNIYRNFGFNFQTIVDVDSEISFLNDADLIVDAIFGIGFHGQTNDKFAQIFNLINKSKALTVSIDVPSGIKADEATFNVAVKANITLTIEFLKLSMFKFPSKKNYGKVVAVDVDIACKKSVELNCIKTWELENFKKTFIFKKPFDSKWSMGKALLIGGSTNMIGAIILAAKACLKGGIGLLKLAVIDELKLLVANKILEATYAKCYEQNGVLCDVELDGEFDVIVVGPGISRSSCVNGLVTKILKSNFNAVFDADALSFLTTDENLKLLKNRNKPTILTPHIREMAKLCGCSVEFIEQNRFEIAKQTATELNSFVVLKGPNTIITTPDGKQFVNMTGNEALATAGTGDILSGLIGAFIARCDCGLKEQILNAVSNAVFVHGLCADFLIKNGKNPLTTTASDLLNSVPDVLNEVN